MEDFEQFIRESPYEGGAGLGADPFATLVLGEMILGRSLFEGKGERQQLKHRAYILKKRCDFVVRVEPPLRVGGVSRILGI